MPATIERYSSGDYLAKTGGTWHLEDAPFKASQVLKMLDRHNLSPQTICEIGCGAGGILAELRQRIVATFVGYEISQQAHAMSQKFGQDGLTFVLGDAFDDSKIFELALVMDVVEHVEDCFGFLRQVKNKATWKLYHIPLDVSASAATRDSFMNAWRSVGHIHVFSKSIALEMLRTTGHEIVDHFLTPGALNTGRGWRAKVANIPRRMLPAELCSRTLGGYSLMVLTR